MLKVLIDRCVLFVTVANIGRTPKDFVLVSEGTIDMVLISAEYVHQWYSIAVSAIIVLESPVLLVNKGMS